MPLEIEIGSARLRYLGHIEGMGMQRLPYIVLHGNIAIRQRPQGAPKMIFLTMLQEDLDRFDIRKGEWMEVAQKRIEWREHLVWGAILMSLLGMTDGWKRAPKDMQQRKAVVATKPQLQGHREESSKRGVESF